MVEKIGASDVTVNLLVGSDVSNLETVLMQNVVDPETGEKFTAEIDKIMGYMRGQKDEYGRRRKYFVAKDAQGKVIGCMAYSVPDPDMLVHFATNTEESAELLNAFVDDDWKGKGVGRKLFNAVCEGVQMGGRKMLLVNSGPRYEKSWPFYDNVCDQNTGFIKDKYGIDRDANTWVKFL